MGVAGVTFLLETPSDDAKANLVTTAPQDADFSKVGGIQTNSFDFSATEIEVTDKDSNENRELLNARGIKSFNISGSGFLDSSAVHKALESNKVSQKLRWFRLKSDVRTYVGLFKITSLSVEGAHDGALGFSLSLSSSGAITETAVV